MWWVKVTIWGNANILEYQQLWRVLGGAVGATKAIWGHASPQAFIKARMWWRSRVAGLKTCCLSFDKHGFLRELSPPRGFGSSTSLSEEQVLWVFQTAHLSPHLTWGLTVQTTYWSPVPGPGLHSIPLIRGHGVEEWWVCAFPIHYAKFVLHKGHECWQTDSPFSPVFQTTILNPKPFPGRTAYESIWDRPLDFGISYNNCERHSVSSLPWHCPLGPWNGWSYLTDNSSGCFPFLIISHFGKT